MHIQANAARSPLPRLLTCAAWLATLLLPASGLGAAPALDFRKVGVYGADFEFLDFTNYKFSDPASAKRYAEMVRAAKARGQIVTVGLYTWDRVTHKKPLAEVFKDTDAILDALDLKDVDLIFLHEEEVDWQGGFEYLNAIYDHVKRKYSGPVFQWYSMPMGPRCDQKADGWILDAYGMDYATFRKHLMRFLVLDKPVIVCVNATPGVNTLRCSQDQVRVCQEFNVPVFYFAVHSRLGSIVSWLNTDHPVTAQWRSWFFTVLRHCHTIQPGSLPAPEAQLSFSGPVELAGDADNVVRFQDDFSTDRFLQQATIHGFLNLAWSSVEKALWLKPSERPTSSELIYHFSSPFTLKAPQVTVSGTGQIALAVSKDGRTWVDGGSLPQWSGHNFWAKVTLSAPAGRERVTVLRSLEVTGGFAGPANRALSLLPVVKDDELFDETLEGGVLYRDDFATQRYLHIGEVTGAADLAWRPGELSARGVAGRGVRVEIRQHFTCERPLNLARITLSGTSIAALGAHNELALSLDGKTPIVSATSAGKGHGPAGTFTGELALDLANEPKAQGVREFWVHLVLANGSGVATNVSNRITGLVITGGLAKTAP